MSGLTSSGDVVIQVENLGKLYRLGVLGSRSLSQDIGRTWARWRGRPDPHEKIGAAPSGTDFWALREISFEIRRGQVLGLIGRNGAGKSTLLKLLSRITAPTTGRIRARGRIASLLEVGTGFHPELTGRENIFLNGAILGMTRAEIHRKLDEIIAFSGVERHIDTPVKRYSSGMYVRLAFSVAAHLEPEILLVDEVLAVGDAEFQAKCLGKMGEVTRQGRTIVFVSHNMSAISQLTDTCLVLDHGRVDLLGPTPEAIRHYIATRPIAPTGAGRRPMEEQACERRITPDARVRMLEAGLTAEEGEETPVGGTISLDLLLQSDAPRSDLRFGYTVVDELAGPVCSGFSPVFSIDQPGTAARTLRLLNLSLAPGTYSLNLSVGQGGLDQSRYVFDMVLGYGRFRVANHLRSGRTVDGWSRAWGGWIHTDSSVE
jgi:lipopolysaccharide transport system ATP-binding protein